MLWGKELEEALAEEERQERERPKRCPECGKSWEPLVIEAWSPEKARERLKREAVDDQEGKAFYRGLGAAHSG